MKIKSLKKKKKKKKKTHPLGHGLPAPGFEGVPAGVADVEAIQDMREGASEAHEALEGLPLLGRGVLKNIVPPHHPLEKL